MVHSSIQNSGHRDWHRIVVREVEERVIIIIIIIVF